MNLSSVLYPPPIPTRASWIHQVAPRDARQLSIAEINFFIYYEVDGDTSKHHLDVSNYGQENE